MISDTLSDAVRELSRYQQELPDIYNPYFEKIEFVKQQMDMLRATLDRVPDGPDDLQGEWISTKWDADAEEKIQRALRLEREMDGGAA
jgi:hypothetical protein